MALTSAAVAQDSEHAAAAIEIEGEALADLLERWPREYVRWILTDAERKRYKNLVTDEERLAFIEGFWRRRDPVPETTDNEYRREYLERYAFVANQFSAGKPGWSTDRGRIYLLLGPPHAVQRNPMGRYGLERPSEIWTYNNLAIPNLPASIDIAFVDFKGTGEFEIVSDLESTAPLMNELGFAESNLLALAMRRAEPRRDLGLVDPRTGLNQVREVDTTHVMMREFDLQQQLRSIEGAARTIELEELVDARAVFDSLSLEIAAGAVFTPEAPKFSVAVSVPYRELAAERTADTVQYRLDYLIRLLDRSDVEVARREDAVTIRFPSEQYDRVLERKLTVEESLTAAPGSYRLQVLLRDRAASRVGLVEHTVAAPPPPTDGLGLSALFIAGAIVKGSPPGENRPFQFGPVRVVPSPGERFEPSQSLGFYLEAYRAESADDGRKRVKVDIFVMRDNRLFLGVPASYLRPSAEPVGISAEIPLRKCTPGNYVLRIRVTDELSARSAEREASFIVVEPG